jgi:hypothetical protein
MMARAILGRRGARQVLLEARPAPNLWTRRGSQAGQSLPGERGITNLARAPESLLPFRLTFVQS